MGAMDSSDILVILIGVALVAGGVFLILRRYVFLKSRCTARVGGKILDKERDLVEHGDGTTSVSYSMKYHYYVNGVEYKKNRKIGKRQLRGTGNDITVFYDPSKPKRHYVSDLKFRIFVTLGLIALGAVLIYYPIYYGLLG